MDIIKKMERIASPFIPTKVLSHKDRLDEIIKGRIPTPVTVEVDLADGFCNNRCSHCFFSSNTKEEAVFLNKDVLYSVLEELKTRGLKAVELVGGGEPTTHPEFPDIVNSIADMGLELGLVTNGHLLYKYRECLKHFKYIRVSLDAASQEIYRVTHGVDTYEKLMRDIEVILRNSYSPEQFGFGYLVMPNNVKDLERSAEIAVKLGIRYIQYRPASINNNFSDSEIKDVVERIERIQANYSDSKTRIYNVLQSWSQIGDRRLIHTCLASPIMMVIQANGNIPLCNLKRNNKEYSLGNIYNQSIGDIWYSQMHRLMMEKIDTSMCPKPCKIDTYNKALYAYEKDSMDINFL